MHNTIIYKNSEQYCSFPSVVKYDSNCLLLAFRVAGLRSVEAAKADQVTHHDPNSSIALIESKDNGKTWSENTYRVVYTPDNGQGVNDPALTVLIDGRLLLRVAVLDVVPSAKRSSMAGKLISHRPEHGLVASLKDNKLLVSSDQGGKWHKLGLKNSKSLDGTCSREPVLEMEDGSLLLSVYKGAPQQLDVAMLLRSFDHGASWGDTVVIASDKNSELGQHHGINFNETAILNLGQGEMLAMVRADQSFISDEGKSIPVGGIGELMVSRSFDAGLSWMPPRPSGIWGQPAHLLLLKNGNILCTYGYRKKPYGVRAVISCDQGHTWSDPIIIRENAPSWDIGYPCSLQLQDKSILTVYYFHEQDGIRYIASTIWNAV